MENRTKNNSISKTCESCGEDFVCNPKDIKRCDCYKISLNSHEQHALAAKFKECICNSCLLKFQSELRRSQSAEAKRNSPSNFSSIVLFCFLVTSFFSYGQSYPPSVGFVGSTAIHKDSTVFIAWATSCTVNRGYQNSDDKSLGLVTVGEASFATGKAGLNGVVSLGDGGTATCQFKFPIRNGVGNDFAVFENAIDDTFLELAFVEVSSDGQHYVRFKSHSLSDTIIQTNGFGSTDASKLNNLAGKYRAGYGTPFDLQELAGHDGLDINSITHIRLVDVVGSLNPAYATYDSFQNKINDPWPTPFPSGGFDLDAIGVIYESMATRLIETSSEQSVQVFPNPIKRGENIQISGITDMCILECIEVSGNTHFMSKGNYLKTDSLKEGIYVLRITNNKTVITKKIVIQN